MIYSVRLTDQTRQAIEDQLVYIAVECASPINAARWFERVYDAIDTLEQWPRRCAKAEEDAFRTFEVRKLGVDSHFLIFTIDDDHKTVWIIGFRYGGMEPRVEDLPGEIPS